MITLQHVSKSFDSTTALNNITGEIPKGSVYGLLGSNGSGKSTLLRSLSGVYRPDKGSISLGEENPFENPKIKKELQFVPDELYFLPGATIEDMAEYYKGLYPSFSDDFFLYLKERFPLDAKQKISRFSKGMKRQTALMLALASQPQYLFLDEAFDGLDPVMRELVRRVLVDAIVDRQMTTIIASHNLRELEELCDTVGILHKGEMLLERNLDELKSSISKIQLRWEEKSPKELEAIRQHLDILSEETVGSLHYWVVRGDTAEVSAYIASETPDFFDLLPLTLEEIFLHEMEAVGYDYQNIIFQ